MSTWQATGTTNRYSRRIPEVGQTVAYNYRAWLVMHVKDVDPTPEELERVPWLANESGKRDRPYAVTLRRLHGEKHERENDRQEAGFRIPATWRGMHEYPDGRVPLCSCHSHPWPCRESDQQAVAEKAIRVAEREMNLLPGCCPACEEPVTQRQQSITFGGPNVRNPLAEGPTFHLRRKCRGGAARYEEAWVADEPGRQRSLLTLTCRGSLVTHEDGSAECFGAVGSDCPSIYARHRSMTSCYMQSRGCGSGCTSRRHGCTPTGHPANPREITR